MKYKHLGQNLRLLCFINNISPTDVSIAVYNDENRVTDIIDGIDDTTNKADLDALASFLDVPIEFLINTNEIFKYFGYNVKMLCYENGIKQKELSLELFARQDRISDIILGKPIRITEDEIRAVANYFKRPMKTLVNKKAYLEFK